MQQDNSFTSVRRLSAILVGWAFGLIVLGNLVRVTNSGLSYLTWPLYQGRVLPDRDFHVLMEWSHRAVAGLLSVGVLALGWMVLVHPVRRARLGLWVLVAWVLLALQIHLGARTVLDLLAPHIVAGHLLTAQLLFATLLIVHLRARTASFGPRRPDRANPAGLGMLASATALAIFGQLALGGAVSSTGASLVCPDFPACNGAWFPPLEGAVGLQMLHRFGAYVLTLILGYAAFRARQSSQPEVRRMMGLLFPLVLLQMLLGALNVLWRLPPWVTGLHLANATGLFGLAVASAWRLHEAVAPAPAQERARAQGTA